MAPNTPVPLQSIPKIYIYIYIYIYLARVIQIYLDRFQSFYPHFFWNNILIFERGKQYLLNHLVQNLWNLILAVLTARIVYVIRDLVQYPCFETALLTWVHLKISTTLDYDSFRCPRKKNNNLTWKARSTLSTVPINKDGDQKSIVDR